MAKPGKKQSTTARAATAPSKTPNAAAPLAPPKRKATRAPAEAAPPTAKETAAPAKAARAATSPTPRRAPQKAKPRPNSEQISLRAYFIAEHRQNHGLPGDPTGDWVEAERQLFAEWHEKP